MEVEPRGLPVAMKAWREHEPDRVLTVRCAAGDGCGVEVGVVYRSPNGMVLESWLNPPEANTGWTTTLASPAQLEAFAEDLGLTGLLADFDVDGERAPAPVSETEKVTAQVDLVGNERYWQNPQPLCPEHGPLAIDRHALDRAVRQGATTYEATPA